MAHAMEITLPSIDIERAPVSLRINNDGSLIGTLEINKATLSWYPPKVRSNPIKVSWEDFAALMEEQKNK